MKRVKTLFGIGWGMTVIGIIGYTVTGIVAQDGVVKLFFGLPSNKLSYAFFGVGVLGFVLPWFIIYLTNLIRRFKYKNTEKEEDYE